MAVFLFCFQLFFPDIRRETGRRLRCMCAIATDSHCGLYPTDLFRTPLSSNDGNYRLRQQSEEIDREKGRNPPLPPPLPSPEKKPKNNTFGLGSAIMLNCSRLRLFFQYF